MSNSQGKGAIKNRARRARVTAGLSIGQAVSLLGIDRDSLLRIEEPNAVLGEEDCRKLADVYGVNEEWLCGQIELRDYDALDRIAGGRELPFHDRDILAEFMASMPRRKVTAL